MTGWSKHPLAHRLAASNKKKNLSVSTLLPRTSIATQSSKERRRSKCVFFLKRAQRQGASSRQEGQEGPSKRNRNILQKEWWRSSAERLETTPPPPTKKTPCKAPPFPLSYRFAINPHAPCQRVRQNAFAPLSPPFSKPLRFLRPPASSEDPSPFRLRLAFLVRSMGGSGAPTFSRAYLATSRVLCSHASGGYVRGAVGRGE